MFELIWTSIVSFFQDISGWFSASTVQEVRVSRESSTDQSLSSEDDHLRASDLSPVTASGVERKASFIGRIREAEKLIDHGYFTEASLELSLAVKDRPGVIKPYLLLGDIYLRMRKWDDLQVLLDRLESQFPDHGEVSALKVRKLILMEDFQGVKTLIQTLKNPVPRVRLYSAVLSALQNNSNEAKRILTELNELPIEEYQLKVGATGVEESHQFYTTMTSPIAEVVQSILAGYEDFEVMSEGKRAYLFARIGKALGEIHESSLVRAFADVSLKEDAQYIDAWILRGYSYFLEERYEEALLDFHQAYRLDSVRPQTHYFMALVLSELGRTGEAIVFFEKALESDFEFSEDLEWKLADLLIRSEKYDQGIALYERLITPETDSDTIAKVIHTIINKAKRPESAITLSARLVESDSENPFYLNMYGWALLSNKQFDEAEEVLSQALDIQEENAQTHLNLGLLYELEGDFKKAKKYYKDSYEYGKNNPDFVSIVNMAAERYNKIKDIGE